jgi:8-oxo-dGTP pyrophosphatase MutT (NUDIX family)
MESNEKGSVLCMNARLSTIEARSSAMASIFLALRDEGVITGWRDELYPVTSNFYEEPVMLVERAAAVQLGIKAYGVHVNGFVRDGKKISLWVARRSKTKQTWPGKLDHIAAGGQPFGIGVMENVIKECEEEAGIPVELAKEARSVGAVCYATIDQRGLKPDTLFVFDLELPKDFIPKPIDGEVEDFTLLSLDEVAKIISSSTEFKTNCSLVIIDFMIRHGFLFPDAPGYLELVNSIRQGDCS